MAEGRVRRCLLLVGLVIAAGWAAAHPGDGNGDLAGMPVCIDPSSFDAIVDGSSSDEARRSAAALRARVRDMTLDAVRGAGVPLRTPASCNGRDGHLRILLDVRSLDPERYRGFGERPFSGTVRVTVERGASPQPDGPAATDHRYHAGRSDLHDAGSTGVPVDVFMTGLAEEEVRKLTRAWWESRRAGAPGWPLWGVAGAALALLGAAIGARAGVFASRDGRG